MLKEIKKQTELIHELTDSMSSEDKDKLYKVLELESKITNK